MCPAIRRSSHSLDRIAVPGVDHGIGAKLGCMRQLAIIDVDAADLQSHRLGKLDGQVAEAADAGNGDPLPRPNIGYLDAFVGGDAGTDDRCGFLRRQILRHMRDILGVGQDVFGKTAVLRVAAEFSFGTNGLPRSEAILAMAASRIEPWHADTFPFPDTGDSGAQRNHDADTLVTGDKRHGRLQRPVATSSVQIGVAYAAGFGFDQDLARPRRGNIPFAQYQGFAESLDDGGEHLTGHDGHLASISMDCARATRRSYGWFSLRTVTLTYTGNSMIGIEWANSSTRSPSNLAALATILARSA